ncbi:MAG: nuclear transport factor 2 family protein [Acidimicrobiales bacterium]|nr:nuclear transport factor 2 family protein [Acidimicrobiales bacterium]
MDTIDRLEAIEAIRQLKARYFRAIDTKDWAALAAVFAPGAEMDMTGEGSGVTRGAAAIAEYVRTCGIEPAETVHHGHNPEITITSDTAATGIWPMEDMLRWPEGTFALRTMHGYGHYHETYIRVDGVWLIQTLRLSRLRVDVEPA